MAKGPRTSYVALMPAPAAAQASQTGVVHGMQSPLHQPCRSGACPRPPPPAACVTKSSPHPLRTRARHQPHGRRQLPIAAVVYEVVADLARQLLIGQELDGCSSGARGTCEVSRFSAMQQGNLTAAQF